MQRMDSRVEAEENTYTIALTDALVALLAFGSGTIVCEALLQDGVCVKLRAPGLWGHCPGALGACVSA